MLNKKEKFQNITIVIPDIYCKNLDKLKEKGVIKNRSEGIREALEEFLEKEKDFTKQIGFQFEFYSDETIKK